MYFQIHGLKKSFILINYYRYLQVLSFLKCVTIYLFNEGGQSHLTIIIRGPQDLGYHIYDPPLTSVVQVKLP